MSKPAEKLPDDPAELRAMIATLQAENAQIAAENAKMSATLRVHDQLVQALRLRIAKLQKLAFGKSSEKIEREIEQLELALEDLLVAAAEDDDAPIDEGQDEPLPEEPSAPVLRRRPCVSDATLRERRELDPAVAAKRWCRNQHLAVRFPAAWQGRTCWRMCWSRSSTITFLCTGSTRYLPAWGLTFLRPHWSAGVAAQ
tara:strand:+ start:5052 stop:5648 length:597 start_codon:yes stop_codon:yes gene_type:complete